MKRLYALLAVALISSAAHGTLPTPLESDPGPLPRPAPPLPPPALVSVFVENQCNHPLRLLVAVKNKGTGWSANGWYTIAKLKENTQLGTGRSLVRATEDSDIYFYAYLPDIKLSTPNGSVSIRFQGKKYSLIPAISTVDPLGYIKFAVTCGEGDGDLSAILPRRKP